MKLELSVNGELRELKGIHGWTSKKGNQTWMVRRRIKFDGRWHFVYVRVVETVVAAAQPVGKHQKRDVAQETFQEEMIRKQAAAKNHCHTDII